MIKNLVFNYHTSSDDLSQELLNSTDDEIQVEADNCLSKGNPSTGIIDGSVADSSIDGCPFKGFPDHLSPSPLSSNSHIPPIHPLYRKRDFKLNPVANLFTIWPSKFI